MANYVPISILHFGHIILTLMQLRIIRGCYTALSQIIDTVLIEPSFTHIILILLVLKRYEVVDQLPKDMLWRYAFSSPKRGLSELLPVVCRCCCRLYIFHILNLNPSS